MNRNDYLSPFAWLFVPTIMVLISILMGFFVQPSSLVDLYQENAPIEIAQFIVILLAFVLSFSLLIRVWKHTNIWYRIWVGTATLACFYVAAEEVSWGQSILAWGTGDFWMERNDQGETNFHNMSSWFDQKPRMILEFGILVGGLVVPWLQKYKPHKLPAKFSTIYPDWRFVWIALLALVPHVTEMLLEAFFDTKFSGRRAEAQELYFYYFVLLYFLMLEKRINVGNFPKRS